MAGAREEVERIVAAVWDERLAEPAAPTSPNASPTAASSTTAISRCARRPRRGPERVTDPDEIAAVDARRATCWQGPAGHSTRCVITDAMAPVTAPWTRVDMAAAIATSLISVGRFDEARRSLARRRPSTPSCPTGWRGGASPNTSSTRPTRWPTPGATSRRASCSSRPSIAPWPRARWGRGSGSRWRSAEIARDTGRAHETIRRFREVADVAPAVGQDATLVWAHVGVAQGHLLLGQCEPAAAALDLADQAGDSPVATSVGTRERTRAWLDACRGDLCRPASRIRDIIAPPWDGVYIFEVALLHDLARLGSPHEVVDRLEALAGCIDGRWRRSTPTTRGRSPRDVAAQAMWSSATRRSTRWCWPPRRQPSSPTCTEPAPSRGWRPPLRNGRPRSPSAPEVCAHLRWRGAGNRAAHGTRAGGRTARRRRPQQPRHRRPARHVDPHRRHASRPRVPQAGHRRSFRARGRARRREHGNYVDPERTGSPGTT